MRIGGNAKAAVTIGKLSPAEQVEWAERIKEQREAERQKEQDKQ